MEVSRIYVFCVYDSFVICELALEVVLRLFKSILDLFQDILVLMHFMVHHSLLEVLQVILMLFKETIFKH